MIQQGVDSGEFREINVDDATNTLAALYEGMILVCAVDGEMDNWLKRANAATELILTGLLNEEKE